MTLILNYWTMINVCFNYVMRTKHKLNDTQKIIFFMMNSAEVHVSRLFQFHWQWRCGFHFTLFSSAELQHKVTQKDIHFSSHSFSLTICINTYRNWFRTDLSSNAFWWSFMRCCWPIGIGHLFDILYAYTTAHLD